MELSTALPLSTAHKPDTMPSFKIILLYLGWGLLWAVVQTLVLFQFGLSGWPVVVDQRCSPYTSDPLAQTGDAAAVTEPVDLSLQKLL